MLLMYHSLPTRCSKITPDIVKKSNISAKRHDGAPCMGATGLQHVVLRIGHDRCI
jgi:hypothetical protein